jgi:hypothetical protein
VTGTRHRDQRGHPGHARYPERDRGDPPSARWKRREPEPRFLADFVMLANPVRSAVHKTSKASQAVSVKVLP